MLRHDDTLVSNDTPGVGDVRVLKEEETSGIRSVGVEPEPELHKSTKSVMVAVFHRRKETIKDYTDTSYLDSFTCMR